VTAYRAGSGLLGAGRGVIVYAKKVIRLRASQTLAELEETLAHELEHARRPDDGEAVDREFAERQP
jgi:hypothetical protein